jgi:hypothetical protein
MPVKVKRIDGDLQYVCKCGSVLVEQDKPEAILHDSFERAGKGGALDETKPLACKFAGARFEVPVVELVQQPLK